MRFSTKANTLKNLINKGFNIPKINIFTVKDYKENKNKIIKTIKLNFKNNIAIRSSSSEEDLLGRTNAGKYKSFWNFVPNNEKELKLIDQIINDYDNNDKNEFFVQEMVKCCNVGRLHYS